MPESLESKIHILEHDVKQMGQLFDRMDVAIEKITDISNCVNKMLAVHEQKIMQNAEDSEDLFHLVEKRRIEMDDNIKEIHSRITTNGREMQKEMNEHVLRIMHAIEELKDVMLSKEREVLKETKSLEDRIATLEKRQWFYIGAATVIGFIAGNMEFFSKLFS